MNFGSSSTGSSNPPPPPAGAYYSYSGSPYSPVYSNQSSNYGYSPSSWPPPPPGDGDDPKKDPAYVYNGYGAESNPDPTVSTAFRPPSEEEKSSSDSRPIGDDEKNSNDLIVPSSVNSGHEQENSSSPLGSNEDSSSSLTNKGCMDEDKKSSLDFRPHESHELLSDLSKFDEKHHHHQQQQDILSNNNNDEYHLGNELEKAHGAVLPYDHHNPHLNHDEWLAANQHLPGSGASMQQHTFPMGMGGYGQQQPQQAQQPIWNYYNSYPQAGHHTPHQDRFMDSPWWNYGPPPPHGPPPHQPQQPQQSPHPPGLQPPGSWALRGPRPSPRGGSERRGPGRPRLSASNKVPGSPGGGGDSSSSASSPSSRPRIPVSPLNSQFPSPYSSSELSPGEDQSDANRKRGPGRPRIGMVDGLDITSGLGGSILEELGPHHPPTSHPPVNNHGPGPTGNSGGATGTGGGKSKGSSNSASSNKKRYVCEICQKRFSTAWYVRVHRKSHNGERPYICHNCGKGFMLPNVLQVHLRKCEKTTNIRPDGLNSPQVRPTNISPGSGGGLPNSNTNSNNSNNHHHAQDSGSPLPQHGVPYPDIYGGLYNQRFQPPPPEPMSYNMHHAHQDPGQQQQTAAAHLHAASLSNYESIPPLPGGPGSGSGGNGSGGFPNDRSPYGSPLFSPSHHFLANDRPPDKGGGSTTSTTSSSLLTSLPPSFPLRCPTCDSVFETQSGLEDHYPCSSFSCSICDKSFSDKGELDSHLHSCHGISCPVCSERFPFKSSLLSHIKITHEKFYLENQQILGISGANGGGVDSPSGLKAATTLLMESEESGDGASANNNNNNTASGGAGDLSSKLQQTPLAMS